MPMLEAAGHQMFNLVRLDQGFSKQFLWNFTDDLPENIPDCKVIVHLAACVDFQNDLNILQYNVNTISTAKLAAYAERGNAYFIFASTVGVHGSKPREFDDTTPINPENNYAMSKYLAEVIIETFTSNYAILRIGGIYGLDGPAHLGLNSAITDAFYKKEIPTIRGAGKAKRNYICVYDVARWILYLLGRYEVSGSKAKIKFRETLYLAGPEIMTIGNYLQDVAGILLSRDDINHVDGPEDKDVVIKHAPYPFMPTTFRHYLQSIKKHQIANPGKTNV